MKQILIPCNYKLLSKQTKVRGCLYERQCSSLPGFHFPTNICLLKVSNRNTRTRWKVCSKLTLKIPERRHWHRSGIFIVWSYFTPCSSVSIVNFEYVIVLHGKKHSRQARRDIQTRRYHAWTCRDNSKAGCKFFMET